MTIKKESRSEKQREERSWTVFTENQEKAKSTQESTRTARNAKKLHDDREIEDGISGLSSWPLLAVPCAARLVFAGTKPPPQHAAANTPDVTNRGLQQLPSF